MGSPASPSSSMTDPWASSRSCLMVMRVRPSSTVSLTGMSMTISRSRMVPLVCPLSSGLKTWALADSAWALEVAAWGEGGVASLATCSASASAQGSSLTSSPCPCSAMALAQSSSIESWGALEGF